MKSATKILDCFLEHHKTTKNTDLIIREIKKKTSLIERTIYRNLKKLIDEGKIKHVENNLYRLLTDTPGFYKWHLASDLQEYNQEIANFHNEPFTTFILGLSDSDMNEEILKHLVNINSSVLQIYNIRMNKKFAEFDKLYKTKVFSLKNKKMIKFLDCVKENLFLLLYGAFNRDRYKPSKEIFNNVASNNPKEKNFSAKRKLAISTFHRILLKTLFSERDKNRKCLKLFNRLGEFDKGKACKILYEISREFNPKELSIYSKIWGLDYHDVAMSKSDKKSFLNINKFLNNNRGDIFKNTSS